jgi:hypothetical protein
MVSSPPKGCEAKHAFVSVAEASFPVDPISLGVNVALFVHDEQLLLAELPVRRRRWLVLLALAPARTQRQRRNVAAAEVAAEIFRSPMFPAHESARVCW